MVGKSLRGLLPPLPATKQYVPLVPALPLTWGRGKNVVPADAGCALYSWDWGETPHSRAMSYSYRAVEPPLMQALHSNRTAAL
jgi:hypothetical protein